MTPTTIELEDDTIPVVEAERAKETAFRWGLERFDGAAADLENPEDFDLEPFRSSAEYANHVLPDLRALAGYRDGMGVGTWTTDGPIAVIEPGDEDDNPATATVHETAAYLFDEIVESWENGAYEGALTE